MNLDKTNKTAKTLNSNALYINMKSHKKIEDYIDNMYPSNISNNINNNIDSDINNKNMNISEPVKIKLEQVITALNNLTNDTNKKEIKLEDISKLKEMIDFIVDNNMCDKIDVKNNNSTVNSNNNTYLKIYNKIIHSHNKIITPDKKYISNFLKNITTHIYQHNKERLNSAINIDELINNISDSLSETIHLDEFYSYIAEFLISKTSIHYYYDLMASHIEMKRIHEITTESLLTTAMLLQENTDKNNVKSPILSNEIYNIILENHERLQEALVFDRDYSFDYFGIKTLERSYLYKLHYTKFKIIERPQHMIMRVALGIHGNDIDSAIETYNLMSQKYFTHATPTLFNAGTKRPQMSSCFLQSIEDNIESIFDAVRDISYTSKWAGGIGVHLTALRARGSLIRGTNGIASGIIPLCILLNKLAKYINQGGKRNGSIACYLEPWHPDIFDFCDLRKNTGNDDNRARDLFLALWVPSLFMRRVENDEMWSLMCPNECPNLNKVHSDKFNELYEKYERDGKYVKQVKARHVWRHILESQSETGFPYILYKDNANTKSNQQNLGTIRSSNLCAEIIQFSSEEETATCNLASICLPKFIEIDNTGNKSYNYEKLISVCRVIVRNLDKIIDRNYYPTIKTRRSNMRHRPMGIGVQGLGDTFNRMGYGYDSKEASVLNENIFTTIYYACLYESKELAKAKGPYESFQGSPFSQGKFQFHLWGESEDNLPMNYDWKTLINEVKQYGTRNSLLTALMPTASTSQIMGNSECIEPYMSNIFKRSTLAGEFIVVNKNLMRDLLELDLWDEDMRKLLIIENGSIQNIETIPDNIKVVYKTAFELGQRYLVKQSASRGRFIDQSQSFNLFLAEPDFTTLTSALFEGHDLGNKTGMYYYRSLPAVNPINFGIDINDIKRLTGRDTTLEMITGGYDITKTSNTVTTRQVKEGEMCQWRPGMKLEDCLSCGS
jgi:ribonucleoside-diphosphate reductase alpha subunit